MSCKKGSKASVNEIMDEYPEEHDEEGEEGNVYNNVPSEQKITEYKIPISDLKKVINEKMKEDGFKNEYEVSILVYVYEASSTIFFGSLMFSFEDEVI